MRQVRLDALLEVFEVGSGDWEWDEEYYLLFEHPGGWQDKLTSQIQEEGIREPILLGSDGRVWDGHHRIVAAMALGLDTVPVEFSGEVG